MRLPFRHAGSGYENLDVSIVAEEPDVVQYEISTG